MTYEPALSEYTRFQRSWDPTDPEALKPVNLFKDHKPRYGDCNYAFMVTLRVYAGSGATYGQTSSRGTFWASPDLDRFQLYARMIEIINYERYRLGCGPVPITATVLFLELTRNNDAVFKEDAVNKTITWRGSAKSVADMLTGRYATRPDVLKRSPDAQRRLIRKADKTRKTFLISSSVLLLLALVMAAFGVWASAIIFATYPVLLPILLVVAVYLIDRYEIE